MSGEASGRVVRVETGSRLHFGLFDPAGVSGRRYGGVGMMIEAPGVSLEIDDGSVHVEAPSESLARRATELLFTVKSNVDDPRPCKLVVTRCPEDHTGLGTGTQLALAIASGYSAFCDLELQPDEFARRTGRGRRSSIGFHGFRRGGFLVDGGQRDESELSPLAVERDFPEPWRVVLILSGHGKGISGSSEQASFDSLPHTPEGEDEILSRLAMLVMLPALEERDLNAFGDALHEYGRRAGAPFYDTQGGVYASPLASDIITFLRGEGVRGVGQSSWGPTLYALVEDDSQASHVVDLLCRRFGFEPGELVVTRARNRGALVEVVQSGDKEP